MHCRTTSVNMCKTALLSRLGSSLKIALCVCNFCQDVAMMRPLAVDAVVYHANQHCLMGSYLPVTACCLFTKAVGG